MFPLGKNLRLDFTGLPELPSDVFSNYLQLPEKVKGYFKKFLTSQGMNNPEDRFLGFFRILESLCYKKKNFLDENLLNILVARVEPYFIKRFSDKKSVKGFLSGINRYNGSKYNTAKCIQDFYVRIEKTIADKWIFSKSDIVSICSLRNDITHANDYNVTEQEIEEKTKFVEVLVYFALFESIGVDLSISTKVIDRVYGYHIIKKPQEIIKISSSESI